jgi:hypothetical protein
MTGNFLRRRKSYFAGATTFSITTLSIMILGITTLGITTLGIMTLGIKTLSIMTLGITVRGINTDKETIHICCCCWQWQFEKIGRYLSIGNASISEPTSLVYMCLGTRCL